MFKFKSRFIFLPLFVTALGIASDVESSEAYSVYRHRGKTNLRLDFDTDYQRQLDPIRAHQSFQSSSPFKVTLTLDSEKSFRTPGQRGRFANFRFKVENLTSDKFLTDIKINGQRYSFKNLTSASGGHLTGAMGVGGNSTIEFDKAVKIVSNKLERPENQFRLQNITTGWWSHDKGDYRAKTVPEPFTIAGTIAALGFGAWFKKKK